MVNEGEQKLYKEENTSAGIKERQIDSTIREKALEIKRRHDFKIKVLINTILYLRDGKLELNSIQCTHGHPEIGEVMEK